MPVPQFCKFHFLNNNNTFVPIIIIRTKTVYMVRFDNINIDKGCLHTEYPLHHAACKHNNQAPSFTKLGSNKSIPLVESIDIDSSSLCIQYYLGSQMSLIYKSTLQGLSPDT